MKFTTIIFIPLLAACAASPPPSAEPSFVPPPEYSTGSIVTAVTGVALTSVGRELSDDRSLRHRQVGNRLTGVGGAAMGIALVDAALSSQDRECAQACAELGQNFEGYLAAHPPPDRFLPSFLLPHEPLPRPGWWETDAPLSGVKPETK